MVAGGNANAHHENLEPDEELTKVAREIAEDLAPGVTNDFNIIVLDVERGGQDRDSNLVVIPTFAFTDHGEEYGRYYVCHEVAHTFHQEDGHGELFQSKLKELCPKVAHFESEYA